MAHQVARLLAPLPKPELLLLVVFGRLIIHELFYPPDHLGLLNRAVRLRACALLAC